MLPEDVYRRVKYFQLLAKIGALFGDALTQTFRLGLAIYNRNSYKKFFNSAQILQ